MTLKQYITSMILGTVIAMVSLLFIIRSVSPQEAGTLLMVMFYLALFCSLLGLMALAGLLIRLVFLRERQSLPIMVEVSFRQGILLGIMLVSTLILQKNQMLTGLNSVMLIGAISSIEMAFMGLASSR